MAPLEPHHAAILWSLLEQQQEELFTDVELRFQDASVRVSKNLVAALSPVFKRMFLTDMSEARERIVRFSEARRATWSTVLSFYYSTEKAVTMENVEEVLAFSHMYQLDDLHRHCMDFLKTSCQPDNCLSIWKTSQQFHLDEVASMARTVTGEEFSAVSQTPAFLELSKEDLIALLEDEEMVTTEDDLVKALLVWMDRNQADHDTVLELFSRLRLSDLSTEVMTDDVMYHPRLKDVTSIMAAVQAEIKERCNARAPQVFPNVAHKRCPKTRTHSIVALCHDDTRMHVLSWSPVSRVWLPLPSLSTAVPNCFAAARLGDTLVVTGGRPASNNTVFFDLGSKRWSQGPELCRGRDQHCMAVVDDTVYVIGGQDTIGELSSIEEFSLASGHWSDSGVLRVATRQCGVAVLGTRLLVVGGNTDVAQCTAQTFDVATGASTVLDVLLTKLMRCTVKAATIGTAAFFVSSEGDLVHFHLSDGKIQLAGYGRLPGFGQRYWFGISVNGSCLVAYGGGAMRRGRAVDCYDLQGRRIGEDSRIENLPADLSVHGVFPITEKKDGKDECKGRVAP